MKKIMDFFNRYGVIIIVTLSVLILLRECSTTSRVKKLEKKNTAAIETLSEKIDSLAENTVTATDLKIEGLKSEKRMIQSCDRKRFDLDRENQIDKEIKELEKHNK